MDERPNKSILVLEPWFGGSHRAFLEGWSSRSVHDVRILGLSPRHWRWRMQAGAWELARRIEAESHDPPDVLFVSDYVDVPQLMGWLPADWAATPIVLYMHENQLTYPESPRGNDPERDLAPGFTNLASICRADACVFNSEFHRRDFSRAAFELLRRLPKPVPTSALASALENSQVVPPGIDFSRVPGGTGPASGAPLRVLFAHRWEHDKDPLTFLRAIAQTLDGPGPAPRMELVLLGERGPADAGLGHALSRVESLVIQDGFLGSRQEYAAWLGSCDVAVSTAHHEFFGIGTVEAMAAGCGAWLPDRLSYPELLANRPPDAELYDSTERLVELLRDACRDPSRFRDPRLRAARRTAMGSFDIDHLAPRLDRILEDPRREGVQTVL